MSLQNSKQIENVKVCLVKGQDGVGIASVEKTGTSGNVDTYTITLDDNRKFTFTVTNGEMGVWTVPVTVAVGGTSVTITDVNIKTTSTLLFFAENSSHIDVPFLSKTITTGQVEITFDALEEATSFKVLIMD